MIIPAQITFTTSFYLTDGGTIVLIGDDLEDTRHEITLYQSLLLNYIDPNKLPGRLYFNKYLVPVRSEMEQKIINLLKTARIADDPPVSPGPAPGLNDGTGMTVGDDLKEYAAKMAEGRSATIRHLRDLLIARVESQEYLDLSLKLGNNQAPQ